MLFRSPAGDLIAVIEPVGGPATPVTCPTTTSAPPVLAAPAASAVTGTVQLAGPAGAAAAPLGQVDVELIADGALAAAGIAPVSVQTSVTGAFTILAAPGATYQLRLRDHAARAVALRVPSVAAGAQGAFVLARPLAIGGTLHQPGGSTGAAGATVELFCVDCTAAERAEPLADTLTSILGVFVLAVPNPGAAP